MNAAPVSVVLSLNPALAGLEPFLGSWKTTGKHPLLPGKELHGRTTFTPHEAGAFVAMHSLMDDPQIPSGVAIFGSDDVSRAIVQIYYDERGVSRHFAVSIDDRTMTWERLNPKFSQRMVLRIDQAGNRIEQTGHMSKDGGEWEEDLSLTYERLGPRSATTPAPAAGVGPGR